jgi:hypothetical protein
MVLRTLCPPEPLLLTRHFAIALSPTLEAGHDAPGAFGLAALNAIAKLTGQENDFAELCHAASLQRQRASQRQSNCAKD